MDQQNQTEEDMMTKLRGLTRLKLSYNIFYIVVVINQFIVKYSGDITDKVAATAGFGWYFFITSIVFSIVRIYCHIYLIKMALKMQELFR